MVVVGRPGLERITSLVLGVKGVLQATRNVGRILLKLTARGVELR